MNLTQILWSLSFYFIGFLYSQRACLSWVDKSRSLNHHLTLQIDMDLQEFLADGVFLRPSDGRAYLHLKARESIGRVDVLDCNNLQASRSVSSIPNHAIVSRKLLYQPVAC